MKTLLVKALEKSYRVMQSEHEDYVSFWIVDPVGGDVKSFASLSRALNWWEHNKEEVMMGKNDPDYKRAEREAVSLCRRMGVQWSTLSEEEQNEWVEEVLDE